MFEYTQAVLDKSIKELNYISYISAIIFQFLYIAFLIGSLVFGLGIIVVNIILLIASITYLVLRIISCKVDFKDEEKIVEFGETVYRRIKIGAKFLAAASLFYGFFVASEQQNYFVLIYMIMLTLLGITQILVEIITPIIKKKFDLLVDAMKHDCRGLIKTIDFFNKAKGERNLIWGDADKNKDELYELKNRFKANRAEIRKQNRKEDRQVIIQKVKNVFSFHTKQ